MTRVPLADPEGLPPPFQPLFDRLRAERGYVPSLYRALGLSPALLGDFMAITADLRASTLEPALRELAILEVARLTGAATQWAAHLPLAQAAGVSDSALSSLPVWRRHPAFSGHERAVLAFAESLTRDAAVPPQTWDAVITFLDPRQVVELALTVAFYNMVARFLNAIDLDVDPEYLQTNAAHGAREPR